MHPVFDSNPIGRFLSKAPLTIKKHRPRRRLKSPSQRKYAIESLEARQLLAANVVINEIHYDPAVKTELVEFVELYNAGDEAADLSGWTFSDAMDFSFADGTILEAGGYLVVSQDPVAAQAKFDIDSLGPFSGRLSNDGETITLRDANGERQDEASYKLGFPWPTVGDESDRSIELINPAFDNDLGGNWRRSNLPRRGGPPPTPGEENGVLKDNAAPQMRQVKHSPKTPVSGEDVTITVKVTDFDADGVDDVASVSVSYQVVAPGNYIELNTPEYNQGWVSVDMVDDGTGGDAQAGDHVYTAVLPGELQAHRQLIRYRISATDVDGSSITGPYNDDPTPNFAYYTYDTTPDWVAEEGVRGAGEVRYESELLDTLPTYQLITTRKAHEDSQQIPNSNQSGYTGSDYLWNGTLVYNGEVYDHISFRARGGVWRYAMGKNMWKFDFNRGRYFQGYDDYGNAYDTKWDKLNFSAVIQQGNFLARGEQGLFESVGFKLFELAGVESPTTSFLHFRIVESEDESGSDKYNTDFQGLYLTIEQPDGRFLEEHDLPDGNFYKMEGGTGTLNNQGPTQPDNRSDLNEFLQQGTASKSTEWWRENLDLERYYNYRTIVEGIHHYDIGAGKNYFYYNNPETGKWQVHPWDLDLTWADNMFGPGTEPFVSRVLSNDVFEKEYRNRMREVRDLLYNPEQTGMLIDEMASFIYTPGEQSFVDADRDLWDTNPIMTSGQVNSSKSGQGRFYESSATGDFAGMIQLMKDYVDSRGAWIDSTILKNESIVPLRSTVGYLGDEGYPTNRLTFQTSDFKSPARGKFGAMEWRIAEVTDMSSPDYDSSKPPAYEINAAWESAVLTEFNDTIDIPGDNLKAGRTYRVRVRMQDSRLDWGHWSEPLEFVAGAPVGDAIDSLRITEINYNPAAVTAAELATNADLTRSDFEFIELQNTGQGTLDLTGISFDNGVTFVFDAGSSLAPGEHVVLVGNAVAFSLRYGDGISVAGEFVGSLKNGGERLELLDATGGSILNFSYDDSGSWPGRADGQGGTLEVIDFTGDYDDGTNWRASSEFGGSPGVAGSGPVRDVVVNEVLSRTGLEGKDQIELLNTTAGPIDVSGWLLSDSSSTYDKFVIPDGTVIAAGGYLVFDEDDFNASDGVAENDFGLSGSSGDDVWLVATDVSGMPVRIADHVDFAAAAMNVSFGRWPQGSGRLTPNTIGSENSGPLFGPILISEIMYNPAPADAGDLEFVELYNPTDSDIDLSGWSLAGGVDFVLPAGTTIDAEAALVIVPFDPDAVGNADKLAAFTDSYGPTAGVTLIGGYDGKLDNGGERIKLLRPSAPALDDPNVIPMVIVDEVRYGDAEAWPVEADGTGKTLSRSAADAFGDFSTSWTATDPSPGSADLVIVPNSPTVTGVYVSSTQWNGTFLAHVGGVGVAIPSGANQVEPLPWTDIDQVTFVFSSSVDVGEDDLALMYSAAPPTGLADGGFRYDQATNTATWSFAEPLPSGNYAVDYLGTPLNEATLYRFDILPGDGTQDRAVDVRDFQQLRDALLSAPGDANYDSLVDFNGSGIVDIRDVQILREQLFAELTNEIPNNVWQPGPPAVGATEAIRTSEVLSVAAEKAARRRASNEIVFATLADEDDFDDLLR